MPPVESSIMYFSAKRPKSLTASFGSMDIVEVVAFRLRKPRGVAVFLFGAKAHTLIQNAVERMTDRNMGNIYCANDDKMKTATTTRWTNRRPRWSLFFVIVFATQEERKREKAASRVLANEKDHLRILRFLIPSERVRVFVLSGYFSLTFFSRRRRKSRRESYSWTTMMRKTAATALQVGAFILLSLVVTSNAFTAQPRARPSVPLHAQQPESTRRVFMSSLVAGAIATAAGPSFAQEPDIDVYFGCGCFWHVQHEFVEAERKILGRSDSELTARAGYAGGKAGAKNDKVCYHNAAMISDYGTLGHAEVVQVKIPPSKFEDFCEEYFKLYNKDGFRPDQLGDRGSEYRNLVGVPGGVKSEYSKRLVATSIKCGDKLDFAKGNGDDPDRRGLSFIMDTADYPFFVAEQYHQFHDGFNIGENYPSSYNGLAGKLAKEGTLGTSDCPNGLIGLGALGL